MKEMNIYTIIKKLVETRKEIISMYKEKYYDFNWKHFREKLNEDEGIKITYTLLRNILTNAGYISPLCQKATRRKKKKLLEEKRHFQRLIS